MKLIAVLGTLVCGLSFVLTGCQVKARNEANFNLLSDSTAPLVALQDPSGPIRGGASATISYVIRDDVTGIQDATLEFAADGVSFVVVSAIYVDAGIINWDVPAMDLEAARIRIKATDGAGNQAEIISKAFAIDSTPPVAPAATLTSAAITSNVIASLTITDCTDFSKVLVNEGAQPASDDAAWADCSTAAGATAYVLTGDGPHSLKVWSKDVAGNVSATASAPLSVNYDGTTPVLTVTAVTGPLKGGSSFLLQWTLTEVNASGAQNFTLEKSDDNGATWTALATVAAANGPLSAQAFSYSWTVPSWGVGQAKVRVSYTDSVGHSAAATSAAFVVDSAAPTFTSGQMSVNGGAASTGNNIVQVSLRASDTLSKITHFCLKYNDTAAPSSAASCWTPVNAPLPGLTPATTLNLVNFDYLIGFVSGSYSLYAWVKDELGHISDLTNVAAGTLATDKASIMYAPGTPPVVANVLAANSDAPSTPPIAADLTIASGAHVYIRWTVTDDLALPAAPINLYYTTNDSTYTLIAANVSNGANAGCTIGGVHTGCYKWVSGSPVSTYYKIRVAAQDANGMTTLGSSVGVNAWPPINFLAGNTDPGLGGSAVSALFFNQSSSANSADTNSLVVTPTGVIYFRDVNRGILKIDPANGIQSLYIPTTGVSSGNGGPASSATLAYPVKIALDYQNRLLIYDKNQIRRVDLVTNTISLFIGGGLSAANGVVPTEVEILDPGSNYGNYSGSGSIPLIPLPNGDLYFQGDHHGGWTVGAGNRIRVYRQSTGLVTSIIPSGAGAFGNAARDLSLDSIKMFGLAFDPLTSAVTTMQYATTNTTTLNVNLNPETGVSTAPHPPNGPTSINYLNYRITGRDGNLYLLARDSAHLSKFNAATNTWTAILGTGVEGTCEDGTAATSCNVVLFDAFITAQSQVYFVDRGRIRTISPSGSVISIMGQSLSFGDGGNALNARLSVVNGIDQPSDTSPVIVLDRGEARFREFAIGGTIQTIAGNGSAITPSTAAAATSGGLVVTAAGPFWDDFRVDGSGNVYYNRSNSRLAKLKRATGLWEDLVGGGATAYAAADGLAGASISLNGYPVRVIGFDGTRVLAVTNRFDGTDHNENYLKLYTITDGTQSTLAGIGTNGSFAADGTAWNMTPVPQSYSDIPTRATYDSFASRWAFMRKDTTQVRFLAPGGNLGTVATLGTSATSFVYRHDGTHNIVYYCGSGDGRLHKYDVTTTTDTTYPWPITSMSCTGRSLIWNATRGSIIFPYTQNGLAGVAEYVNL